MINNADGVDVDSSRNVLIENCTFCQGDDALVFKSGKDFDGRRAVPTENVVIENVTTVELRSDILGLTTRYFFGAVGDMGMRVTLRVRGSCVRPCGWRGLGPCGNRTHFPCAQAVRRRFGQALRL